MNPAPAPGPHPRGVLAFVRRFHNVLLFVGGFSFDWLTVGRIDSWTDIAIEIFYLGAVLALLILQYRVTRELWRPGRLLAPIWRYNVEALHFLYGGLLSINVVLYFRSSTGARPIVFFVLLGALLIANELPHIRRLGDRVRLGLYAFCLTTFMIYFVPLLIGSMGDVIFILSVGVSAALVFGVSRWLARGDPDARQAQRRLFVPAAAVLAAIVVLYFCRLIPPVPLSIQGHGIYHDVRREATGEYVLRTIPPGLFPWRKDGRPFLARTGDRMIYFVRVFAPSRFKHQVTIRWERWDAASRRYVTTDLIPMDVLGGRDLGYRGYAFKSKFDPGSWRVGAETEDGRCIGRLAFEVLADERQGDRKWSEVRM